jgi:hypothetical protein
MPASHFDVKAMTGRPKFIVRHSIICFKIKNPPPVELCWQKKEIPRKSFFFLGWLKLLPKFDIELLKRNTK